MPPRAEPASPVYMTYIYNLPSPGVHTSSYSPNAASARSPLEPRQAGERERQRQGTDSSGQSASGFKPKPYLPLSQCSQTELDLKSAQSLYANFHVPWNQHNRFLTPASKENKVAYRTLERAPPPPFGNPGRPSSAPPSRPGMHYSPEEAQRLATGLQHMSAGSLSNSLVTGTGAPTFTVPAVVQADIEEGCPLYTQPTGEPWRTTRVEAYVVPPHPLGFGPGGARPFHQDYRHYKYYGFAGKGAKTSWGHNPKEGIINARTYAGRGSAFQRTGVEQLPPRYLDLRRTELIDPHIELVDIETRRRLTQEEQQQVAQQQATSAVSGRINSARVTTYRAPQEWHYTLAENPSPMAGSQSPFHQRYSHYKYFGFAGKGATSSWGRNPKCALL